MEATRPYAIRAVLFDFDGTLTGPGGIDFRAIKKAIGCPPEIPILEWVETLAEEDRKREAMRTLERFELEAARQSRPNAGAEECVAALRRRGLPLGILTRNCLASVRESLRHFLSVTEADFAVLISREDALRPKPHPDGVLKAAAAFRVEPAGVLVVGDYVFDIEAGIRAGARTAFLTNGAPPPAGGSRSDWVIGTLGELERILDP